MSMAARITPGSHAPCAPGPHRHEPVKRGGACAYWSPGRPGDICGREAVAVYINPDAPVRNTYRCSVHDREVSRRAAAEAGYRREAVAR